MQPLLLAAACIFTLASAVPQHQQQGLTATVTYQATWASLDSRPTPAWWVEQKFSLFMHWGLCE